MKTYMTRILLVAMFAFGLMACNQSAHESIANVQASSLKTSSASSDAIIDDANHATNQIECTEPRPEMCTQIYQPVCGTVDTGIRCVTTPCPSSTIKTFGNACTACSNTKVSHYQPGECQNEIENATNEKE